jgi:hypothetical protein
MELHSRQLRDNQGLSNKIFIPPAYLMPNSGCECLGLYIHSARSWSPMQHNDLPTNFEGMFHIVNKWCATASYNFRFSPVHVAGEGSEQFVLCSACLERAVIILRVLEIHI